MVVSSSRILGWSQIKDMNFFKMVLMCNGAKCYITSVFPYTSLDVWLHFTCSVPYWNSCDESFIKHTLGLHWCFTTSGPHTTCPSQYICKFTNCYTILCIFKTNGKSAVLIKLEDVLFPVVTSSGIGRWYLFGSEVLFFFFLFLSLLYISLAVP